MNKIALLVLASGVAFSTPAYAGSAEAEIEGVSVRASSGFSPEDVFAFVEFTGVGDKNRGDEAWLQIEGSRFKQDGLDRIQSLLISALLSGKTVWFIFDDASGKVHQAMIKADRS